MEDSEETSIMEAHFPENSNQTSKPKRTAKTAKLNAVIADLKGRKKRNSGNDTQESDHVEQETKKTKGGVSKTAAKAVLVVSSTPKASSKAGGKKTKVKKISAYHPSSMQSSIFNFLRMLISKKTLIQRRIKKRD